MEKSLLFTIFGMVFLCLLSIFASQSIKSMNNLANVTILSGDIGGTNARLQLSRFKNGKREVLAHKTYKVADHDNVVEVIHLFLAEFNYKTSAINNVCFAVAGPIKNNRVKLTNSPWLIDAKQLKDILKIDNVKLINDFEAIGYGLESLTEKELHLLQHGTHERRGLKAFVGAGTGLGVGFAIAEGSRYVVHASEGGHASFAPADDLQIDILKQLRKKYNSDISAERLLSGSGTVDIYQYFREVNPFHYVENEQLKKSLETKDSNKSAAKKITDFALEHPDDPMATKTLATFVAIYGAKLGDIAFTLLPRGGLYIVGNIAATTLTQHPYDVIFMQAFHAKDHLSSLLKDFPVWVVLDTEVGLRGAENYASRLVSLNVGAI